MIDDAEESEWCLRVIAELMDVQRRNVGDIQGLEVDDFITHGEYTLTTHADHGVRVSVFFQAAVAAGRDLKIPQIKIGLLAKLPDQFVPHDVAEGKTLTWLVGDRRAALPGARRRTVSQMCENDG